MLMPLGEGSWESVWFGLSGLVWSSSGRREQEGHLLPPSRPGSVNRHIRQVKRVRGEVATVAPTAGQPRRGRFLGLPAVPPQSGTALARSLAVLFVDSMQRGVACPAPLHSPALPSGLVFCRHLALTGSRSTHAGAHGGPEAFSWLKPPS
jgi:hypothetical protein